MNKDETLSRIDLEWQQFLDEASGIPPAGQMIQGAVGHWSVRESLLHVAAWDAEQVEVLKMYLDTGEVRDYGDDAAGDPLNEDQVKEKEGLTLDEVSGHLRQTHQVLLDFLGSLPEDTFSFDSHASKTIATESFRHYREHRQDIERFKATRQ